MGNETLLERARRWISDICFRVFLWSSGMTREQYEKVERHGMCQFEEEDTGGRVLCWTLSFDLPRPPEVKRLKGEPEPWVFYESRRVVMSGEFHELAPYRSALDSMRHQLDRWIAIVDRAMALREK